MNYLKFPKFLIEDERYSTLPDSAKLLYTLMLDRVTLSEKNGWFDEHGNVYIIFTQKEAARLLSPAKRKVFDLFNMLKNVNLIETGGKRNSAYIFYVKKPTKAENGADTLQNLQPGDAEIASDTLQSPQPEDAEIANDMLQNLQVNKNYINKTEISKNKKSHSSFCLEKKEDDPLLKQILENCELEIWNDGTYNLLENALRRMYYSKSIKVCGRTVYRDEILKSLLKQSADSVIFAYDSFKNTKAQVVSPQEYLISLLFNAPYDYEAFEAIRPPI